MYLRKEMTPPQVRRVTCGQQREVSRHRHACGCIWQLWSDAGHHRIHHESRPRQIMALRVSPDPFSASAKADVQSRRAANPILITSPPRRVVHLSAAALMQFRTSYLNSKMHGYREDTSRISSAS